MYLPFLRGKQFELLALREFAKEINRSTLICPVVEPVKAEFKGLETAINELITQNVNFTIVVNPVIGEIEQPEELLKFISNHKLLKSYTNYQVGLNSVSEKQITRHIKLLPNYNLEQKPLVLIYNDVIEDEEFVKANLNIGTVKYHIFNNSKIKGRRFRRLFDSSKKITLDDLFVSKSKNADYLTQEDEFFSDEYLNYEEEGYIGFSDFLTIGDTYSDSGFLPYAVAIHITYESSDGSIRIRHFVSDTNDDYSDTPGKFSEALEKLIHFIPELTIKTKAIEEFESFYLKGHYPGLGTVKKLSILHHLELMHKLLTR